MFQHLIYSIQKVSTKKIAEIVVRPNISGSDDFSILLKVDTNLISESFTQRTGIASVDFAYALEPSEAFSILRSSFDAHRASWYTWSEFDASLIKSHLSGVCSDCFFIEDIVQRKTKKKIQDIQHALELLDIPHLGDETDTEKMQKILEKVNFNKKHFFEEKKAKKYIIEMNRQ